MSVELVLLRHNEPMTTSLAIAEGTENTHDAIMKMVRKYISALQEFGRVGFEIEPFDTAGGIQTREVAFLNEPQATLLITFLRNSEIVVRFKVALVKAFYELRARLKAVAAPQFTTRQLDHGADLAVAADRTFRSFMRAARSAGLPLHAALRIANQQTQARTGMDMLAELGLPTPTATVPSYDPCGIAEFVARWLNGDLPVPCCICKTTDYLSAYQRWCADHPSVHPASAQRLFGESSRVARGLRKTTVSANDAGGREWKVRSIVPPGAMIGNENSHKGTFYAASIARFADALAAWRSELREKAA